MTRIKATTVATGWGMLVGNYMGVSFSLPLWLGSAIIVNVTALCVVLLLLQESVASRDD